MLTETVETQMDYLSQLNEPQREAVVTLEGPLLVISGAGSGKTRVVTFRIAHLLGSGVPAHKILAVTFTNKAALEMRERVQQLTASNVLVCTFHSLGARILRESIHNLGYTRDFVIYDEEDVDKLIRKCIDEVCGEGVKPELKPIRGAISTAKNALLSPEESEEHAELDSVSTFLGQIYAKYQHYLKQYNAVDFDDLLLLPVKLFKEHPEVKAHYQQRWEHLLIDEYQDTNAVQYAIVKDLVDMHGNLCVVGDPDQSIYSWRGADIRNILNFERDFPGAKVVRLEQNYRSRSNILEAANQVISYNRDRYEKDLWSDLGAGELITLYPALDEIEEANFVAKRIVHHHAAGVPLRQMVVFYRTNAQSRQFEEAFLKSRIPYTIVGGLSFYQRREIKDVLAFLRMALSGNDYVAFERTINIPKRGLGDTTIERLRNNAMQEGRTILGYCTALVDDQPLTHPTKLSAKQKEGIRDYVNAIHRLAALGHEGLIIEMVKCAIQETGYIEHLKNDPDSYEDRRENLESLVNKATEWCDENTEPTLSAFLEEISLKSTLDEVNEHADRVNLMTIHNGKGLEFTVTFVAGLEEFLFPHANSIKDFKAIEEERRLFYVGMTRAKENLYLCYAKNRRLWGTLRSQTPSRFLDEIPKQYLNIQRRSLLHREQSEDSIFSDEKVVVAVPPKPTVTFAKGDTVFHRDFGIGMIIDTYDDSVGLMYKVFFPKENRERTLVAKLAPLKKL